MNRFFPKMEIWGIFFLNREKNQEALRELGITPDNRVDIIRTVREEDYVETLTSLFDQIGELWVFGKDYEGIPLYIKLAMGAPNSQTVCISMHKAEHNIQYAFK